MTTKLLKQSLMATIVASVFAYAGCATMKSEPPPQTQLSEKPRLTPVKYPVFEDQACSTDSVLKAAEEKKFAQKRSAEEKRLEKAKKAARHNELLSSAAGKRRQNLPLTADELAAEKIDRLQKAVEKLVVAKEYEKARELIWRFSNATNTEEGNEIVLEARKEFLSDVVNVKHWFELENEILEKVRPLMEQKKYAEIRAYLKTVKPIRTYTVLFDEKVDSVVKSLVEMGIPEKDLTPVSAATRQMIAAAFAQGDEKYEGVDSLDFQSGDGYNGAVKELWETLVRHDCSVEKANEIIADLRKGVSELVKKYCVAEKTDSSLSSLGTTQFNKKLETLCKTIVEKVEKGEELARIEAYKKALAEKNFEMARRLAIEQAKAEAEALKAAQPKVKEQESAAAREAAKAKEKEKAKAIAAPIICALVEQVRANIEKSDWDAARAVIRDEPRIGQSEVDLFIFAARVGLLNSEINPAQLKATLEAMQKKHDGFFPGMKAEDLNKWMTAEFPKDADYETASDILAKMEDCKKWLEEYSPAVLDDYVKIAEALQNSAALMEELGMSGEEAQCAVADVQKELQDLLDKRTGSFKEDKKLDYSNLEKALKDLASAILDQKMEKTQYPDDLLAYMKAWADRKPEMLTTHEMNLKLLAKRQALLAGMNLAIDPVKEKVRIEAEKLAYKKLVADMDRAVNFNTQISLAKDALDRGLAKSTEGYKLVLGSQGFHSLLGEYIRSFRMLKKEAKLTNDQKQTLLVGGAWLNQPVVVEWALTLGADIDAPASRDALARPALLAAIRLGYTNIVRLLLEKGASASVADSQKNNVLHYASRLGSLDLIAVALKANDVNARNAAGETALFAPAALNHLEQVKALLEAKADAKIADAKGLTAFDVACDSKSMLVLDTLLDAGAPLSEGAFRRAVRDNDLALAKWFVDHGVDVNGDGVMKAAADARDLDHKSEVYDYLVRQGGIPVAEIKKPVKEAVVVAPEEKSDKVRMTLTLDGECRTK